MCLVCHLHPALWLHGRLMGGVVWHRLGVSLGMSLGAYPKTTPNTTGQVQNLSGGDGRVLGHQLRGQRGGPGTFLWGSNAPPVCLSTKVPGCSSPRSFAGSQRSFSAFTATWLLLGQTVWCASCVLSSNAHQADCLSSVVLYCGILRRDSGVPFT